MKRLLSKERHDWKDTADKFGFKFHTIEGERYWDESAYYQFSMKQIENDIEDPTNEIHAMCLDLVSEIVNDSSKLTKLAIPERYWDEIRNSWMRGDQHLYGRMDFSYDGNGPAKLLELNYDTPTSLYEAAFFQWIWLEQAMARYIIPTNADQFNILQESSVEAFKTFKTRNPNIFGLHFTSVKGHEEDRGTVQYLQDCAAAASLHNRFVNLEDIGIDADNRFSDSDNFVVEAIFKLYPWEYMFEEEYGKKIPNGTIFLEPIWKSILSNKGILPMLWDKHTGHPNLLESHFGDVLTPGWVKKPLFSREGSNVSIMDESGTSITVEGPYDDCPHILQKFHPLPCFSGNYTVIGSWVIGDRASGIGIREDSSLITKDSSRFLPHIILD
jgi:glutathionylspermidine synthase